MELGRYQLGSPVLDQLVASFATLLIIVYA